MRYVREKPGRRFSVSIHLVQMRGPQRSYASSKDSLKTPAWFKCRLVAWGSFLSDVVDYNELYPPVACIELVRLALSVATSTSLNKDQLDVKRSFLNAKLPKSGRIWIGFPNLEDGSSACGQFL